MRKIVQIIYTGFTEKYVGVLTALCDDGTLFVRNSVDDSADWKQLPGVPQPLEEPPAPSVQTGDVSLTPPRSLSNVEPEPRTVFIPEGYWRCYKCGLENKSKFKHCVCENPPTKVQPW